MSMKPEQHVFVLECDEASKTDYYYLLKILRSSYFDINFVETKLSYVYLGGKTSVLNDEKLGEIKGLINRYGGQTHVHFVFDSDRRLTKDKALNKDIVEHINGLSLPKGATSDIIWFNRNIEAVCLGRSVGSKSKVKEAERFYTSGQVVMDEKHLKILSSEAQSPGSNILKVLYQYLPIGKKAKSILDAIKKKKKH